MRMHQSLVILIFGMIWVRSEPVEASSVVGRAPLSVFRLHTFSILFPKFCLVYIKMLILITFSCFFAQIHLRRPESEHKQETPVDPTWFSQDLRQ